jgi:hypothetical protein
VLDAQAAARLCQALDWPEAPALLQVRVDVGPQGSAKPMELAQALGVWGPPDPRAPHALVARLGFPGIEDEPAQAAPESPSGALAAASASETSPIQQRV